MLRVLLPVYFFKFSEWWKCAIDPKTYELADIVQIQIDWLQVNECERKDDIIFLLEY